MKRPRAGGRWQGTPVRMMTARGLLWGGLVWAALTVTNSGAADCSTIMDLYQKAQCATANMKASGALSPSSVTSQQGAVP